MSKIKSIGGGFIQCGSVLYNLRNFKQIQKHVFGIDEGQAFGICVFPINPSKDDIKNGVQGEYFITTYMQNESDAFELDFEMIVNELNSVV